MSAPEGSSLGMLVADTCIVVRLVANDDAPQVELIRQAIAGQTVWVGVTVLLETVWVLGSRYQLKRAAMVRVLQTLLATQGFELEDHDAVQQATLWFAEQGDFADALHLARSLAKGPVLTLDAAFCRAANAPVQVLKV